MLFLVLFCPPLGGGGSSFEMGFHWLGKPSPASSSFGRWVVCWTGSSPRNLGGAPKAVSPSKRQVNWGSLGC